MKTIFVILTSAVIGIGVGWFLFSAKTQPVEAKKILYYQNPMNSEETSSVPKKASDGMDFVPVYETKTENLTSDITSDNMVLIDPTVVQKMGVHFDTVKVKSLSKIIRTVGKVSVDETKQLSINSKISGWVEKLYVDYTGKLINKNQPMLEIYSPELVSTQEEYIQAVIHEQHLANSVLAEAKYGAASLAESAKKRLLYWDISDKEIKHLEDTEEIKKTLILSAPSSGYVLEKMVVQGQKIEMGMELFKLADLSTVWILADIYQQDLSSIKINQTVSVALSYSPDKKYLGRVSFIYPTLNEETKTGKIRIDVQNTSALDFKPGMFATIEINTNPVENALIVAEQSIIKTGRRNVVIVSLGDGKFEPKEIETGITSDGFTEVKNGLLQNEIYVTSSQFLIDSESNIKAAINQLLSHQHNSLNENNHGKTEVKNQAGKSVWVCPMHPDIIRDQPGHCPKCNMVLVEKKL